jgi:hypothetical protein
MKQASFLTALVAGFTLAIVGQTEGASWDEWHNSLKPAGKPGEEMTLAVDGKTDYVIVTNTKPTSAERKAALELAHWLKEITGATFPILENGDPTRDLPPDKFISIGRTSQLEQANLPIATRDLEPEGYAIAQQGSNLFLIGGSTRGPINAVFCLLEEDLGCRWYTSEGAAAFSGIDRISRRRLLTLRPVPRSYAPAFDNNREPYYTVAWDPTWSLRNRTNANNQIVPEDWGGHFNYVLFGHSFDTLLPPSKYFEDHPEYFMETDDGERISKQPCVTHPEVLRIVTENMLEQLKERPDAEIISLSYNDGQSHCRCDRCMVLNEANNGPQGALMTFVNQVAEAVEKEYPNIVVCTDAYNETLPAPTQVRPRHNVGVRICNSLHQWRFPLSDFTTCDVSLSRHFREEFAKWSKICDHLQVWDYTANHSHFLAPLPNMHTLGPSLRFYRDHGVRGLFLQGIPKIGGGARAPMRVWVMAKMMWDPSLSVHELQQDFIWGTWDEIAPVMAEYYELLEGLGTTISGSDIGDEAAGGCRYDMDAPFITQTFIDETTRLFDRAETLAVNQQRLHQVELARLPIMYVKLMRGPAATGDEYEPLIDRFETIARREGIDSLGMHSGTASLDMRLEDWRGRWSHHLAEEPNNEAQDQTKTSGPAAKAQLDQEFKKLQEQKKELQTGRGKYRAGPYWHWAVELEEERLNAKLAGSVDLAP